MGIYPSSILPRLIPCGDRSQTLDIEKSANGMAWRSENMDYRKKITKNRWGINLDPRRATLQYGNITRERQTS